MTHSRRLKPLLSGKPLVQASIRMHPVSASILQPAHLRPRSHLDQLLLRHLQRNSLLRHLTHSLNKHNNQFTRLQMALLSINRKHSQCRSTLPARGTLPRPRQPLHLERLTKTCRRQTALQPLQVCPEHSKQAPFSCEPLKVSWTNSVSLLQSQVWSQSHQTWQI